MIMDNYIEAYFIVPPERYDVATYSFDLYKDNESQPIRKIINAFPLWQGQLQAHDGAERIVCKARLEPSTVIAFHRELSPMIESDMWEKLLRISLEAALAFAMEIADNMTINDVVALGITHMYGGRTFQGLLENYPELAETDIQDMVIA